jgi:DNA-binding XRE family transcriptional regulator
MIDMLKRHQIQVLRDAGHLQVEVATLAGVSVASVRRVERETNVTHLDLTQERAARGVGRPSKAEPFRTAVVELLAAEPALLSVEILRRMKLTGSGLRGCRANLPNTTLARSMCAFWMAIRRTSTSSHPA